MKLTVTVLAVFVCLVVLSDVTAAENYPRCEEYDLDEYKCHGKYNLPDKRSNKNYCCTDWNLRPGGQKIRGPGGEVTIDCRCYTSEQYCSKFYCP